MFGKLKEKLQNWTKNLIKKSEEVEKPKRKKKEKKPKKEIKAKSEKKITREIKKELKEKAKELKKEKKLEKKKGKEIEVPIKTISIDGIKEPDLEKFQEIEEEEEENNKIGSKSFFKRFGEKISKIKISEKEFEIYSEELEMLLLENNVALEVAEKMVKDLKEKVVGKEFLKKEIEFAIKDAFGDIIREILISPPDLIEEIKEKALDEKKEPYVILFCGINGSGKTTTIAKVAEHLKSKKISCVIAAGDTFRAASIEQIKTHGEKIGVKVIAHDYGADPASVGFDAIQYAKKNFIDCVLIDTAGRMHTQKNLLREMEKIVKVCKPEKKIFVGESITGNDAVEQVRSFDEAIGIDGIVLTKADIDEKGGTALSVGYVTKKPIFYLGTGQEYEKIEPFSKEKFIEKLGL
jgi:fused signal recognition particle receptor